MMTLLAVLTALLASRYFGLGPDAYFPQQRAVYLAHQAPLLLHVAGGTLAIALGPWQFVGRIRTRFPRAHRTMGLAYVVSVLAAGVGGLLLAPRTFTGPVAGLGFTVMAVVLLTFTVIGFVAIRRRQIERHRAFVTRSYAIIFGAATFRLWITGLPALGVLSFEHAYASGAWASWLLNLAVAEMILRWRPVAR